MAQPRIALCGAGMITGVHTLAAHQLGFSVITVASRDHQRALRRAQELECRAIDYDQLPDDADIVIVATPPALHFDHAVHAREHQAWSLLKNRW